MIAALARVPYVRLVRARRAWLPIAGWILFAVAVAIVARTSHGASGSDHVMRGTFRWLVLPLVAYAVVGVSLGGEGLKRAVRGVVALGALPRRAALATTLVAMGASALVSGALALIVCVLAHGPADPPFAADIFASTWVSALGGLTYGAYFSAGSAIGKGGPRGLFLAFDWIFGGGASGLVVVTPRGHLDALMGGPLCAELPARASSVLLLVLAGVYAVLAVVLVRRP